MAEFKKNMAEIPKDGSNLKDLPKDHLKMVVEKKRRQRRNRLETYFRMVFVFRARTSLLCSLFW